MMVGLVRLRCCRVNALLSGVVGCAKKTANGGAPLELKLFTNSLAWIGFLISIPLTAAVIFIIRSALYGVPTSKRVDRGGPIIRFLGNGCYWFINGPTNLLIRMRATPDMVTLVGLAIVFVGAGFAAFGYFGLGGFLIIFGSLSDMIDGEIARRQGSQSDAGEFLDAMVDRYADIAIYAGLAFYYVQRPWAMLAIFAALLGTVMMSYARAKAESLGIWDAPSGTMRRAERTALLGYGILLAPVVALYTEAPSATPGFYIVPGVCAFIALLANLGALQITVYCMRKLRPSGPLAATLGNATTEPA